MLTSNSIRSKTFFRRFVAYQQFFPKTIATPYNYNISLDSLRKENRALLLANRDNDVKTTEINKMYTVLNDDMSRYILYLNSLSPNDYGGITASNLESDGRVNKIKDFEFLEEIMDTMEHIDNLENETELNTIHSNVLKEILSLKQGIDQDFENGEFDNSLEKFQKMKYFNGIIKQIDSRLEALEELE